jgi:hypothetical protein
MKRVLMFAAASALAGISFTASAWYWGPYGNPYLGAYAPGYAVPAYGYALSQDQINAIAEQQRAAAEQWATSGFTPWIQGPWGWDPLTAGPGDFVNDPFMPPEFREMFRRSEAEREQSLKISAARRAAARARAEAQRAALEARRRAFFASTSGYGYGPYPIPSALGSPEVASAPVAEAPAESETEAAPAAETEAQ